MAVRSPPTYAAVTLSLRVIAGRAEATTASARPVHIRAHI